jgi:hypothetical protein
MHKNKRDHILTQLENMFVTVELLCGTRGQREKKKVW